MKWWERIKETATWLCVAYFLAKIYLFPDHTPWEEWRDGYSHGSILTDAGHPLFPHARAVVTVITAFLLC